MARKRQSKTLSDDRQAWTECFLLCDYARAEHGKLYIVGGGWDEIVPQRLPLDYQAYLAIKLVIPFDNTSDSFALRIELLDANFQVLGDPVYESTLEDSSSRSDMTIGVSQAPQGLEGRPRPLRILFMTNEVKMKLNEPGLFTLRLLLNDEELASTRFVVSPLSEEKLAVPSFIVSPPASQ